MNFFTPHKKTATLVIVLFSMCSNVVGQTEDIISNIAEKHMLTFTLDSSFHGEGWEKIKNIAENHKYFLIGEDHGLSEIPLFTNKLIAHVDYDLFVTEIDSITASISKEIASKTSAQIDSFHFNNPSALSFYSAKEEFELIEELTNSNADFWGLDQVSLFSTGIVFRRLNEICNSKKAKELAIELARLSDDLFIEATRTGNYDTLFIYSAKQEVFDNLREVLQSESVQARGILNDIETSWKIYNGIDNANYSSRIRRMKSKLLNYYSSNIENRNKYKKVLYKFGAYHVGKSESALGYHDVGNFVSNIAEAEGASSYHLMIIGKKGGVNSFLLAEGMKSSSFDISNKKSALHGLSPFANLVDENTWAFFNLKPIKKQLKKENKTINNSFLRNTLNSYDGLIIIPEATPSVHY